MTTIATTDIFDMSELCDMAFDGSKSLFTYFCQFFGSDLWIFPNLFFNPYIKCITLGITLSASRYPSRLPIEDSLGHPR